MKRALWVTRDRVAGARAIDDLLADASARAIFDLVVQVPDAGALDHLARFGATIGVRIHVWVEPAQAEDVVAAHPVEGIQYDCRANRLDATHVERAKHVRPGIVISATIAPEPAPARDAQALVDVLCPMTSTRDARQVERLLAGVRSAAPRTEVWGGLTGFPGERTLLREQVRAAERSGCEGAILFAYDPKAPDLLDIFASA